MQLVLVRGDFSHHLSKTVRRVHSGPMCARQPALTTLRPHTVPQDAERLLNQVRHWYLHEWRTVRDFNEHPSEFDFQRFMDRCP